GGRQASLILVDTDSPAISAGHAAIVVKPRPQPLLPRITAEEREAHAAFIAKLGTAALWGDYFAACSVAGTPSGASAPAGPVLPPGVADRAQRNRRGRAAAAESPRSARHRR